MHSDKVNFVPLSCTLAEIRSAIPERLFIRSTVRSSIYLLRDLFLAGALWSVATYIDPFFRDAAKIYNFGPGLELLGRTICWLGLVFTGLWVMGHECGHGAFSPSAMVCDTLGYVIHSLLWTPYFSWKFVHHRHHANHASMEKDEVYVPKTRSELGIPEDSGETKIDYTEYFTDTPVWTLFTLIRQQLFAFPAYLIANVSGQKHYPKWTNHFDPNSVYFTNSQRNAVLASDFGLLMMTFITAKACAAYGWLEVVKFYGIPWLCVLHWFVMITYLHHTSADLPHYRSGQWNYQRGAVATVDRDFLGWQGRFFLHDVAHYHVIHHFFPKMSWYNGEEATQYLKRILGTHYHRSEEPVFSALWRTYNQCQFVEDEGDIIFYKDKAGKINISQNITE
ncbi:uncharacterized protein FOMMEDRAFT_92933 [Fomitiporia mediterranea MF3/22]|uniref:uncharacterized protein n=1 Tax=Fomitiporia mediterranea (strain MF3/22) TaxID=694068 RepID=UPI000440763B|nr:uncharacterized protein FOMMEDRAFT_92933 [Fomitiporia mediterranea MF3/22]EJC99603.1 hypothetical protein FOMMEDRAFT_92933 [Fomitiporia mediterranea MF3/22]